MNRITSFEIDHTKHPAGLYLSRVDGQIFTYDLRIRTPYIDNLLTNAEMHSLEHMLATTLRNCPVQDKVVYVGPMGCQTGFYVLLIDAPLPLAKQIIVDALKSVLDMESMPGNSKIECGNFGNLSNKDGKRIAKEYLQILLATS